MDTKPRIIGTHLRFFREGAAFTLPAPGTVGKLDKPGATDPAWVNFGNIMNWNPDTKAEEKEVWVNAPGKLVLDDVVETKHDISFSFEVQQLSPLAMELILKTSPLDAGSTQYNPLEGSTVKGWIKGQQYDHNNTLFNTFDFFVHLKINGGTQFGEDIVKPQMQARILHSILNTGTLA